MNWLKNNWKKILIFILLIVFDLFFHVFFLFSGSVVYFTLFSASILLIFSLSIFEKFYKNFLFFVLFLLFIQALIYFIPFPKCSYMFKTNPGYACKCSGVKKYYFTGNECVGKITKCYNYFKNPNIREEEIRKLYDKNIYDPKFEVSCDSFPENLDYLYPIPLSPLSLRDKTTMKFEHFIVKSWEDDYPNLALNEYFCMRAIKNAKLPTPEFYITDDLKMFIMKRFDIDEDNSYLGFEDMCVLTARATEEKYDGGYEEIARVIKDIIAPQKRKESLKILFKAVIMNHLLRNGDGHLKNYGIVYKNDYKDSYLAPIYDVITTTIYIKNDIPALRLGDAKLWWREKTYKTFAKQSCGLSNSEYKSILLECKEAITKTKQEINNYKADDKNSKDFLEKLKECWYETI